MKEHIHSEHSFKAGLIQNTLSGLTVSFVAISLGAAFGILSERGAFAGIVSAGIIALITSLFGGTRIQCSGPTAPMTAVTAALIGFAYDQLLKEIPSANPDHFVNMTLILTGILLVLFGVLRLGKFISKVPRVVISGFMNGIAVLIWLDQIKRLFGLGGKQALEGSLGVNILLSLVALFFFFALPGMLKKVVPGFAHFLPATLITIVVLSALSNLAGLNVEYVQLKSSISSWSEVVDLVKSQIPTSWEGALVLTALKFAVQLALLAYLDTLLTSLVIDKKLQEMTKKKESTKQNKELIAQGVANAAIAFLGGIPGAQATIRSVLILNEKATWRFAGIMVGIFVLVEAVLFQQYISLIPQAVFVGLLIKVGYDVFDWHPFLTYVKGLVNKVDLTVRPEGDKVATVDHFEMFFIMGTAIITVLVNLNVAVIGFCVLFYLLKLKIRLRDLDPSQEENILHED